MGDDFGFNSFNKYYYEQDHDDHYLMENFEVSRFNNNKKLSYDRNIVSRMCNNMVGAVKEQAILPKFVLVVMDVDMIEYFIAKARNKGMKRLTGQALTTGLERILTWLMCQYDRVIATHKDFLPKKAKRKDQPKFVWVQPPLHKYLKNNEDRKSFNEALNNTTSQRDNNFVVQLKKIWDEDDSSLVNDSNQTYTSIGLTAYWNAVDKAAKYADTLMFKKEEAKKSKMQYQVPQNNRHQTKNKHRSPFKPRHEFQDHDHHRRD